MTYQEQLYFVNQNHSHPEYPEGAFFGELRLTDNGIVFTFNHHRRNTLVIAWKNLISTYPSFVVSPDFSMHAAWLVLQIPAAISVMTAGVVRPYSGMVSIKYKEVSMDRVVVSEFASHKPLFFISPPAKHWANDLDAKIWEYKKDDRGLEE